MNRPNHCLINGLLLAVLALPCVAAAQSIDHAQAPVTGSDAASEPAQPAQDQAAKDQAQVAKDKKLRASPYCLQHTGSMIRQTGGRQHCSAIGDVYSREDLQRTGTTDIGDALRRLDSSIH